MVQGNPQEHPALLAEKDVQAASKINKEKESNQDNSDILEIEPLLYALPAGRYLVSDKYNNSYVVKKSQKKGRYGVEVPVVEIEPLKDSVPLTRNNISYGVRGFCFPTSGDSYVHIDDIDTYRVNYHENLHMRIYRTNPNHPEWEIRMLEDWRLGEEKHN